MNEQSKPQRFTSTESHGNLIFIFNIYSTLAVPLGLLTTVTAAVPVAAEVALAVALFTEAGVVYKHAAKRLFNQNKEYICLL